MKHGIFVAYWNKRESSQYYIDKIARLGFDSVELGSNALLNLNTKEELADLKAYAADKGVGITIGAGLSRDSSLSSPDPAVRERGKAIMTELMEKMNLADVRVAGGAGVPTYWPMDYSQPVDKVGDRGRSIESMRELAKVAEDNGVLLCAEVVNRFESHILNTAEEALAYVKEIGSPKVKILLDTFHMNIEEDSIPAAIRLAGDYLGHLHTGESNRKLPGSGHLPWREICEAVVDIGYDDGIVMEPFVISTEHSYRGIRLFRDLSGNADEAKLDRDAAESLIFFRHVLKQCQK
ncbi:MAG: hypothetical protein A2Y73_02440 [Chloroflexi bacterium RBG_13_56_8]|nr:MAG: hypothetical protein A2Y73_02440 [Chloroflexi bacterium RBG_13_56_8]